MRIPLSFCVPPIVRICLFVLSLCAAECRSLEQQQQQQQQSQQYERAALDDSENNQGDDYVASDEAQDTTVLVTTLIIYGPALVILLILFSIVRTRYPTIYNVRSVVDRLYNPLAVANGGGAGGGKAGCFGWIWHVWHISDDSLLEHCSLDAVCVLRIVRFGRNLAMVSVFCSWFLIPVYTTSPTLESEEETPGTNITSSSSNSNGTVGWTKTTTTYLPPDSYRYTATVLAAYIVFGYFMVSLLKELKWFTEKHESYLAKQENPTAQSYTVYVSGIPPEYRSNTALAAFFCQILSRDSVHQASMVLNMPKLNAATVRQTNLKLQLERAQALAANDERKGGPEIVTATATTKTTGPSLSTDNTDSNNKKNDNKLLLLLAKPVDYCIEQLELETQNVAYWRSVVDAKLEDELVATPSKIQSDAATANNSSGRDSTNTNGSTASTFVTATQSVCAATIAVGSFKNTFTSQKNATSHGDHPTNKSSCADHRSSKSPAQIALNDTDEIVDLQPSSPSVFSIHEREIETTQQDILRSESIILSDTNNEVTQESIAQDFSAVIGQEIQQSCFANLPNVGLGDAASKVAKTVVGLIESDDEKNEGKPMDVGFVTFTKLSAVSVALQVVHSTVPYQMEVAQAPSPEELLWGNVGLSQQRIQSGKLLAIALTTALCIFWTVPVTLLISLTEVNALKKDSRFLQEWVDAAPWLENVLNQVAPLLISFLNQVLLPQILRCISRLEGALGASQLEAALFTKLSAFHVRIYPAFVLVAYQK